VVSVVQLGSTPLTLARKVIEDVAVLGKVLPKGTVVLITTVTGWEDRSEPMYADIPTSPPNASEKSSFEENEAVRRNESLNHLRSEGATRKVGYWSAGSAMEFVPERWLDSSGNFDINAGPSTPFGLGQRACFGKNLAVSATTWNGNTADISPYPLLSRSNHILLVLLHPLSRSILLATPAPGDAPFHGAIEPCILFCPSSGESKLLCAYREDCYSSRSELCEAGLVGFGGGRSCGRVIRDRDLE
jgi:hypothetical protein